MRWFRICALIAVAGCATAGKDKFGNGTPDANGSNHVDAPNNTKLDAPNNQQLDAPVGGGGSLTMAESTNNTMVYGKSLGCPDASGLYTQDDIWYRVYQLSDYPAVTGAFQVTGVTFLVQEASAATGITVKLGTYAGAIDAGTLNSAQITSLGAPVAATVPNTTGMTGETVNVPITAAVPAGSKFVVEVVVPDLTNKGYMYIGATTAGESHPGYISSAGCAVTTPTKTSTELSTAGQIILNVTGTY